MAEKIQSEAVLSAVKEQRDPGVPFTARDLTGFPDEKLHSLQSALWNLYKKGFLEKPRGKGSLGRYILRSRRRSPNAVVRTFKKVKTKQEMARPNPAQAIYDLLEFMAKAEAPLLRAAKILEAVDNA
jgi:hypothetical protein